MLKMIVWGERLCCQITREDNDPRQQRIGGPGDHWWDCFLKFKKLISGIKLRNGSHPASGILVEFKFRQVRLHKKPKKPQQTRSLLCILRIIHSNSGYVGKII